MTELKQDLKDIFATVFGDDSLDVNDETTAADIDGWDSIAHMNLVIAVEKRFGIRFAAAELATLKTSNVGDMLRLIADKKAT